MRTLERLARFFGILIVLFAIIFMQIFIGIAIASMAIVPITYFYCKSVGRSYSSTIDSSYMLYNLNKLGQWALLSAGGFIIFI